MPCSWYTSKFFLSFVLSLKHGALFWRIKTTSCHFLSHFLPINREKFQSVSNQSEFRLFAQTTEFTNCPRISLSVSVTVTQICRIKNFSLDKNYPTQPIEPDAPPLSLAGKADDDSDDQAGINKRKSHI